MAVVRLLLAKSHLNPLYQGDACARWQVRHMITSDPGVTTVSLAVDGFCLATGAFML